MNTKDYISDYQKRIGKNIENLMKIQNVTQNELTERCKKAGFDISQSTISNAKRGQGNITMSSLLVIAHALNVNIMEILDAPYSLTTEKTHEKESLLNVEGEMFVTNPESAYIKGYLGTFHLLFYKTSGASDDMVRGTLTINPSEDKTKCDVILQLDVNEITKSGEEIKKVYKGQLIFSPAMRSVYVLLLNQHIGEISMLLFQQIFISYHQVETAMAVAITTASGANRRPAVHRMCLSRKEVGAENIDYIKGQLLMNTSDIFLTDEQLKNMLNSKSVPDSFKEILKKIANKGHCYRIPEANLIDTSISDDEQLKIISYVRSQSISPKYNKVSKKTDDAIYALLGKNTKGKKK